MVGLSASIWAVPAPKTPSPAAPAALPAPPPAPKEEALPLLGRPDLTSETHAIAGDADKEMGSAKEKSGLGGKASSATFNEEGLPLLYRPNLTSETRAIADEMSTGMAPKKKKKRAPRQPHLAIPPEIHSNLESLAQQERELLIRKEALKVESERVRKQIGSVRHSKSIEIEKMTGDARREALKTFGWVKLQED